MVVYHTVAEVVLEVKKLDLVLDTVAMGTVVVVDNLADPVAGPVEGNLGEGTVVVVGIVVVEVGRHIVVVVGALRIDQVASDTDQEASTKARYESEKRVTVTEGRQDAE